jgi:hypothetical protein
VQTSGIPDARTGQYGVIFDGLSVVVSVKGFKTVPVVRVQLLDTLTGESVA